MIAVTRALSVASGSSTFQPKRHELVVAQPRQRRADPDEEVDEEEHLPQHDERVDPRRRMDAERQPPAAEEERRGDRRDDDDHVQVLGHVVRAEARAAVLGDVAADQLGVGLREVERRAVGLGEAATRKMMKPTNCGMTYHMPACASTMPTSDSVPRGHDHADEREALRHLVGDELRRRAHRAEERVLRAARPAAEHEAVEGDRAQREDAQRPDRHVHAVEAGLGAEDVRRRAERDDRDDAGGRDDRDDRRDAVQERRPSSGSGSPPCRGASGCRRSAAARRTGRRGWGRSAAGSGRAPCARP